MTERIVVARLSAWLSPHHGLSELDDFNSSDPTRVVSAVSFFQPWMDMASHGYTRIGDADIALTINDEDSLREAAVESLREQIKAVRAEAENKITELTRRINELQAIEYAKQGK